MDGEAFAYLGKAAEEVDPLALLEMGEWYMWGSGDGSGEKLSYEMIKSTELC